LNYRSACDPSTILATVTMRKQETQLSLEKTDHTAYVRSPVSGFRSRKKSNLSEVTQFHARYVNETISKKVQLTLAKHTSHAVTRGRLSRRYKQQCFSRM